MTIAVLRFPGTNNENDMMRALSLIPGADPYLVPSGKGPTALKDADGAVIPGGFSYGDYIRAGAVAGAGETLDGIRDLVDADRPVLGVCNGFQILVESGILPGALLPNQSARFLCKWICLKITEGTSPFTEGIENAVLRLPIAHAEGNYYCSDADLERIRRNRLAVFRYSDIDGRIVAEANPNGSLDSIAGIVNEKGNVIGMMPHPERASRPSLGSTDGLMILENFVRRAH